MLPREAAEREAIASSIATTMSRWGFSPVETPVAEVAASLERGMGSVLAGTAFRLFDSDGTLLALRPEMTVPIARLVATRLAGQPGPYRLRYEADVFREQASLRGQARQFTQIGLEFIGADGPSADAEVVSVLVESLRAAGLREFTVGVGTVAVLQAIVAAAGMDDDWGRAVTRAAHDRDLVGIDDLASAPGVPTEAAEALRAVPRIRGTRRAIEDCRLASGACGADAALDALDEMWDLLDSAGVSESVSIDFGIMRSFDYYTGMVLEVYAPGLGLSIGGGGRYDDVMALYGASMPAAGFAVGIERLHIALAEQRAEIASQRPDAVLGGRGPESFAVARRLRDAGWRITMSAAQGIELVREADRLEAPEALAVIDGRAVRLDRAGEPATVLEEPIPAPPSASWAARDGEVR